MLDRNVTGGGRPREHGPWRVRPAASHLLGVSTWIFGELPLRDIARRVRALGYDGVELAGPPRRDWAAHAAALLAGEGLTIFSLTPENVDLAHPDPGIRRQAIDYYLQLVDLAAELGNPLVSCHGLVGRVRAFDTVETEQQLLVDSVRQVATHAAGLEIDLVVEALNRYESHLLNTAAQAVAFVDQVGCDNLGILLDAYHMNIEEADPPAALRTAGERLWLYHLADSNRQGIGRGHTDVTAQLRVLAEIGYAGPLILECTAPGPDPFIAVKDAASLTWLETYLLESRGWLAAYETEAPK